MKSAYRIFRSSKGLEDVCMKSNAFITELTPKRLISVSCVTEPASANNYTSGLSVSASPLEFVVVVWYWDEE